MNPVLTVMCCACTDLRFEGGPPLLEFMGGPLVPPRVNELAPSNIVFHIEVQRRDSKYVIRKTWIVSRRHILVDEDSQVGLTPTNSPSALCRRGQRVAPGNVNEL